MKRESKSLRKPTVLLFAASLALSLLTIQTLRGQMTITTANDSGPGSLRDTIGAAASGTTIDFAPGLSGQTIFLTSGQLLITKNLNIDASGLAQGIRIDGSRNSRIFEFTAFTTNSLVGLELTNGVANGSSPGDRGGGIYVSSNAVVMLHACTVAGNAAAVGGGILVLFGSLTAIDCTIANNEATTNEGGGIYVASGMVTLTRCTVSQNNSVSLGGGMYCDTSTVDLENCTLAGNSAQLFGGAINLLHGNLRAVHCTITANSANDIGGIFNVLGGLTLTNTVVAGNLPLNRANILGSFSGSNNLTSGDPALAALGDYGGPTQTGPALPGSPVVNAGLAAAGLPATDQRGQTRILDVNPDIGAVEGVFSPQFSLINPVEPNDGSFQFSFANLPGASFTVFVSTNVALPLNQWGALGLALESPPSSGQFQFSDPEAGQHLQRFYQVRFP